ncbi:MAG TPA: glycosyltransferase family 4 protein [Gemmatimonadaceae bacterium]|nr:glycosyltransferase family 4 protein [Gemmatimonadaceae bacterium]
MMQRSAAQGKGKAPRRILLVETTRDGTFGGSFQALYDLARHIDRDRYTPVVIFYEHNPFVERLRERGVSVIVWEAEWYREHGVRARWFSPRRVLRAGAAVARRVALLHRERIDLVHVNNSPSYGYYDWLPAARLAGIPCVTHLRGELYPIRSPLVRWLNCRFDRFITISTYVTGILERERFPHERIVQVEDGIDHALIRASVKRPSCCVRRELSVPEGTLLAVMVGHLRRWKGQDVVLLALAGLEPAMRRQILVAFVGADDPNDSAYRQTLEDLVRVHQLEPSVRFLGSRLDVPDLMNAADVVLHASTTPEPFGLVVLEGMAHGRLVIAAALGGPVQVLGQGGGWLFDPRDPAELTALLRRAMLRPGDASACAATAPLQAQKFTIERTADRVQAIYGDLLS